MNEINIRPFTATVWSLQKLSLYLSNLEKINIDTKN